MIRNKSVAGDATFWIETPKSSLIIPFIISSSFLTTLTPAHVRAGKSTFPTHFNWRHHTQNKEVEEKPFKILPAAFSSLQNRSSGGVPLQGNLHFKNSHLYFLLWDSKSFSGSTVTPVQVAFALRLSALFWITVFWEKLTLYLSQSCPEMQTKHSKQWCFSFYALRISTGLAVLKQTLSCSFLGWLFFLAVKMSLNLLNMHHLTYWAR